MIRPPVVIVGAGIAGLSCAVRLAQEGAAVTVLETSRRLGGRASSFVDQRSGETLDSCQHVTMGCCTNFLDLCERLGVDDRLSWSDEIRFVKSGGRESVVRPGALPAPLHTAGSFLLAPFFDIDDKASTARAMLGALRTDRAAWRDRTFAQWLLAHEQTRAAIDRFWTPVVVSACNLRPERVSAATALHVVQEGFLTTAHGSRIAVATVPLVELYEPARRVIESRGGEVCLGVAAARVEDRRVVLGSGDVIECERVVLATPPERAAALVADVFRARDPRWESLRRVRHSPIVGVHVLFDRPVMDPPHAALVDRGTQWVFTKDGARLHAVVSAADAWIDLPEGEIVRRVLEDVVSCFPRARGASVVAARSIKERRATFAATPAFERLRPSTTSDATGVILAGDYTDTGWPATMESAARSGYLAAAAALGKPRDWALRPPLRPSALASLLGGAGLRRSTAITR